MMGNLLYILDLMTLLLKHGIYILIKLNVYELLQSFKIVKVTIEI